MKLRLKLEQILLGLLVVGLGIQCRKDQANSNDSYPSMNTQRSIEFYHTNADGTVLFEQKNIMLQQDSSIADHVIEIDASRKYQSMQGFGFALTGGSATHIMAMNDTSRGKLLDELFGNKKGEIGLSYLRISLGGSDLDAQAFSYNDLPDGEKDLDQRNFSIDPDKKYLIPLLKEILKIKPDLLIMASPWSPPTWMKTNGSTIGGELNPVFYDSYALYFLKYLMAMKAEGIEIDAITLQNEPLHPGNNPSMHMTPKEQADFVKKSLGPLFKEKEIETKIIVYDHNADKPEYPIEVLSDPEANAFINGSAFHLYGGDIENLSEVHKAFPEKDIYFTEQWYSSEGKFEEDLKWHLREVLIGGSRNWASAIIEWNLSSNADLSPHTPGGCTKCLGAISIVGENITRNAGYYVMAHAAPFVVKGSKRIQSDFSEEIPNVTFLTPENKIVLILMNNSKQTLDFSVIQDKINFSDRIKIGDIKTYIWDKNEAK